MSRRIAAINSQSASAHQRPSQSFAKCYLSDDPCKCIFTRFIGWDGKEIFIGRMIMGHTEARSWGKHIKWGTAEEWPDRGSRAHCTPQKFMLSFPGERILLARFAGSDEQLNDLITKTIL